VSVAPPAGAPPATAAARAHWRGVPLRGALGLWLALLALVLVSGALSPNFLAPITLLNTVRQASVVGIAAVGVTLVMITGGVDLSIGAVISLSPVLAASLMAGKDGNIPLAVAASLLMGVAVGAANGLLVARWKVPPFILTLGMATVVLGLTQLYSGGTAAGVVAPGFRGTFNARIDVVPVLAIVFAVVVAIGLLVQERTRLGRRLYLVGANPRAARLAGVPVGRTLMAAYVISGLLAALAGLALLARSGVSSTFAGQGFEFDALAAIILGGTTFQGGRGGIAGTVAGVLILAAVFNLVNILGLDFDLGLILKGGIIFGVAAMHVLAQRREEGL
jgi:ribose/xylose/arabinose/galactoside ABC-type transport system permease subunit